MTLIDNAGAVWHRLWSVRLAVASAVMAAGQTALDMMQSGQPRPVIIMAFLLSVGSAIGRLVQQASLADAGAVPLTPAAPPAPAAAAQPSEHWGFLVFVLVAMATMGAVCGTALWGVVHAAKSALWIYCAGGAVVAMAFMVAVFLVARRDAASR